MTKRASLLSGRRWSAFMAGCFGLGALALLWAGAEAIGDHVEQDALEAAEQRAEALSTASSQYALRALAAADGAQVLAGHWADHAAPEESGTPAEMARAEAARAEVAKLLADHIRRSGGAIGGVAITDASGTIIWHAAPATQGARATPVGTSVADQPWFQAHAAAAGAPRVAATIAAPMARAGLPGWIIPVSARLETPEGGFGGIVVVAMDVGGLADALAGLANRPGEVAAILRPEGDLLVRSADTEKLLGRQLVSPRTRTALQNGETRPFRSRSPLDGTQVMLGIRPVPGGAMLAMGSVDLAPGLAAAKAARGWARLAALAAWVVIMSLVAAGFAIDRARSERRALTAQQAGRAEIERLLAGLPAIIFLRDVAPDGLARHLYRNGDSVAVSGWPEQLLPRDQPWASLADPDSDFDSIYRQTLAEGQAVMEWRMRQPDGGWAWMRTTLRLLERRPDGSGLVVGYIVNVTAERAADARALSASRLASLGEMGAGLAHELRQPLTAISLAVGVAVMAAKRGDMDRVIQRLDRILDQVKRGSAIIDYLRRFARGGEEAEAVAPVAVTEALHGALTLCGAALREAEIEVLVTLSDPPPMVLGHAVAIEQVLVNLLFNARDAVADLPPGETRRIDIAAVVEDGVACLSVADNGGGIAASVMGRVFEPFVTTKGPDRGAGLGLSICHGLMRSMGGGIEAENVGAGARFTLSLPSAPEMPRATARGAPAERPPEAGPAA